MMRILPSTAALLVILFAPGTANAQTTWYVDDDCAPPGAGTEVDPFCTIQMGVDAASDGDTILVRPGTYTGGGNRDISLFGKPITLKSPEGPQASIIDVQGGPGSIHRAFFLIHGESLDAVIEGFTVRNAYLIGDTGGTGPGGGGGGAIYIRDSSPTIRNCIIKDNISATLSPPFPVDGRGGGVYVDGNSSAIFENCIIADNHADRRGGGVYVGYEDSTVSFRNCLVVGNTNGPNYYPGGGIYLYANCTISNTTIAYNISEGSGGGVTFGGPTTSILINCILWGNQAGPLSPGDQLAIGGYSFVAVSYSAAQNGLAGVANFGQLDWGPGMLDVDPLLVDSENGAFHLLHGSPCIDAGNNLAVPEDVTTDLDGGPRFLDDPTAPDTGNPDPDAPKLPIVDMGPYEYDPDDCNNNDIPDADDLADGTSIDCDGKNGNGIPDDCEADCNENDQADSCDIALGLSEDCTGNAIPDECEPDCNENGQADSCDLDGGISEDCTGNGIPDECEADCNDNGAADSCDIADETSTDCNDNAVPDECEEGADCNDNGQLDSCDIAEGSSVDCFGDNGQPDGVPDECCPGDVGVDKNNVGPFDLAALLATWGPCPDSCIEGVPACQCPADFDRNCTVNAFDLAFLLGHWGPCQ